MDLYFSSRRLQKLCSKEKEMVKQLGVPMAKKLKQRLVELRAAEHLGQITHLPPPRCHELTGNRKGIFSLDLVHPMRLLVEPADEPIPLLEDGGIDRDRVMELLVLEIADTH